MATEAYVKEHKMEKTVEDLLNSLKSQPENPFTAMVRGPNRCGRSVRL
eukprot:COSAG02_NODE_7437_length_3014_cov_1.644475_1_plen_48_part_00